MTRLVLALALAIATSPCLSAKEIAGDLDGYACMNVALPGGKLRWDQLPQARGQPSTAAPYVGPVGATVIARYPLHIVDGYAEVLLFNGKTAWVSTRVLEPYRSMSNPRASCTPVQLTDGSYGIR